MGSQAIATTKIWRKLRPIQNYVKKLQWSQASAGLARLGLFGAIPAAPEEREEKDDEEEKEINAAEI